MAKVCKLTEEGKEMMSWQFDETVDMDRVRCIINEKSHEMILAQLVERVTGMQFVKYIDTRRWKYKLYIDIYGEYYLVKYRYKPVKL